MTNGPSPRFDRADRALGRLFYGVVGMLAGLFTLFSLVFAVLALRAGEWMGLVLLVVAGLGGWATRYCFRSDRRLSDAPLD